MLPYVSEFVGNKMQALMMEKFKLYGHLYTYGTLPPVIGFSGNATWTLDWRLKWIRRLIG
jgi:hypothetical protein